MANEYAYNKHSTVYHTHTASLAMILIGWRYVVAGDIMNFWHYCDSVRQNKDPRRCLKYSPKTTQPHTYRSCEEPCPKTHTWGVILGKEGYARNVDKRIWISKFCIGMHNTLEVCVLYKHRIWILNSRLVLKLNLAKMWSELQAYVFSFSCLPDSVMAYGYQVTCQHVYHDHIKELACLAAGQTRFIAQGQHIHHSFMCYIHLLSGTTHTD